MAVHLIQPIGPVNDKETHGKRNYHKVYAVLEESIDYGQLPKIDEAARTCPAFTFKQGAQPFVEFSAVRNTVNDSSEGSKGDITSTVNNNLSFTLGGGLRPEVLDFLENHQGDTFLLVTIDKYSQKKYLHGRPYDPMALTAFTRNNNGDSSSAEVTFSNESFNMPIEYLGDLPVTPEEDGV